jgi:hypothetical protein
MKTSSLLKKAKALIDTPDKWCQHTPARDAEGTPTDWLGKNAASYCVSSAFYLAAIRMRTQRVGDASYDNAIFCIYNNALLYIRAEMKDISIPAWNDRTTHSAVMAVFDAAIKNAERDEEAQNGSGG